VLTRCGSIHLEIYERFRLSPGLFSGHAATTR